MEMLGDMLDKGGVVMVILLLLSVYSLTLIFLKLYQCFSNQMFERDIASGIIEMVRHGQTQKAMAIANGIGAPMGRVLASSMQALQQKNWSQDQKEQEIFRAGQLELREMERHMKPLEMVANVAPLLGLLGTVVGMVKAFSMLETAGSRVDPALLAGGIWEALLTTVGGLAIAIPALAAHYFFDSIIERFRAEMQDATTRMMQMEYQFTTPSASKRVSEPRRAAASEPARAKISEPRPGAELQQV